ncbi:Phosphotransferase enzyme family protein [Micromonospora pattaloongensis]|uniref:Phosphotransferase enzyme family protein n=1 Tax=Micromonospora pattaloongensis TaxID=405436 RepID=A0A1H3NVM5_9ACTN|nr:Phosphotransferase enzyme family protein [Micromonospora pattaloongensis]
MALALPVLRDRAAGWRRRRERAWAAAIAPRLVAEVAGAPPVGGRRAERAVFTSTAVLVVTVTGPGRRYVVKVPWTAEGEAGLRRQARVLTTLRADPRLSHLRPVLPRCLGQGEADGRRYWVEEALPGTPADNAMLRRTRRSALLRSATRVIRDLHHGTGEPTPVDDAAIEAWVGAPLRRLAAFAATRPGHRPLLDAVRRTRRELVAALAGRTVRTSWIHGDFWPGNLLAGRPRADVTGVVDWDRAGARELPLHDLLHLHVFARRLTRGDELGDVVVHALRRGLGEALAVPDAEAAGWLDGIPPRSAVLLYWLRHIQLFIDSEGDHDSPRWLRGNVERVLVNI